MSYCRWSCDSHRSDIYAYESISGGFVIHIARNRRVGPEPRPEYPVGQAEGFVEAVVAYHRDMKAWIDNPATTLVDIDHPQAGQSITVGNLEDLQAELRRLQAEGIHVPAAAFERIAYEIEHPEEE